ncbi:hypothetical protein BIW11_10431 [Tropilaelaps mercedesae]|uniref:Uncharacterized protein n=1 Tax=Tropilaelaps mercedesae TaxID=418985 RepID=A0A1V9XFQ9_9ACAR|nr:hypothetical protein BIW11_10431 [Tropilaelaps mercedesae]
MNTLATLVVLCAIIFLGNCELKGVSLQDLCSDESKRQNYSNMVLESLRTTLKENEPFKMEDDIRRLFRLFGGRIYNLHEFVLRHPPQVLCDDEEDKAHMVLLVAFNTTKV